MQLGLVEREDEVLLSTHYSTMKAEPGYAASQSYQVGIYIDLIRYFAGKEWQPSEIGIEHPVVPELVQEQYPARFAARLMERTTERRLTKP